MSPDDATVHDLGASRQFQAIARDQDGNEIQDISFTWTSVPDSVATVDDEGTVTAQGNGAAIIEARASGHKGSAQMLVRAGELTWTEGTVGSINACGVTTHGTAFCWGDNVHGQVGNGTTSGLEPDPVKVQAPLLYFNHITVGAAQTCGLTQDNTAYCWGNSSFGEGGYGEETSVQTQPQEVSGGLSFAQLTAGANHTCGLTTDGEAYCWGQNVRGQLGDGTTTNRTTPVQVAGEITFSHLVAANESRGMHTCGVATDGTAYCWGDNRLGQLGDGSTSDRNEPTAVDAEVDFTQMAAGKGHTCGITTEGTAYCWGQNNGGALGDGTTEDRLTPVEVEGEHTFDAIVAGRKHTCGLTPDGRAFCWGENLGQIGDGTNESRVRPVEVAGGHVFTQLDAGGRSTIGVDDAGVGYFWGQSLGFFGAGSGTNEPTALPDPGDID